MAIELTTATPQTLLEIRQALSAVGSVGNETVTGLKTFSNDVRTNGRFLSGGVDLASLFVTSETDNQLLAFNNNTGELIITGGNTVVLSAMRTETSTFVQNNSAANTLTTSVCAISGNGSTPFVMQFTNGLLTSITF